MNTAQTNNLTPSAGSHSLRDAITSVHVEFSQLRRELREASRTIARLEQQLADQRWCSRAVSELDLASLRRGLAFHCHPDRGGDPSLMKNINALFDVLSTMRTFAADNA
jgi:hypothetical protein